MDSPTPPSDALPEGEYNYSLEGETVQVQVRQTMTGPAPSKHEALMAHFSSGPPRFPHTVKNLLGYGGTFTPLSSQCTCPKCKIRYPQKPHCDKCFGTGQILK